MAYCEANDIDIATFPEKIKVRHSCDFGPCCNPKHLSPGTQADNAQDMVDRGRSRRGILATGAILTDEAVRDIKIRLKRGEKHHDIAALHGVTRPAISQINIGKNWGWLKEGDNHADS